MSVTYKDIDQLSQKSAVEGTEKLPVSDTEYITPTQMLADISSQLNALSIQVNKISSREQFPQNFRYALLACFDGVTWSSQDKTELMDSLEEAMEDHGLLLGIVATYSQTSAVTPFSNLDELKSDLVVVANYEDGFYAEVFDYTLSGNLNVGTSTITVLYGNTEDTISVSVTYKYTFSLGDGSLTKVAGSTTLDATKGWYLNIGSTQAGRRRSFPTYTGEKCFRTTTNTTSFVDDTDYFPIPVPSDATSITISITPDTQYFAAVLASYTGGVFTSLLDTGWQLGSYTISTIPSGDVYMSVASKYNSSGSSYPTEPSQLTITFNK